MKYTCVNAKHREKLKRIFFFEILIIMFLIIYIFINLADSSFVNRLKYTNILNVENKFSDDLYLKKSTDNENSNVQQYVYGNNIDIKKQIAKIGNNNKVESILKKFDTYPLTLMKGVARNPETLDFAYNYSDKAYGSYSENIDLTEDIKTRNNGVPILMQWDDRWGYASYCNTTIGISGCGPTCLSMVYIALTGDTLYNPLKMARFSEQNGYVVENIGTSWSLFTQGATSLGLYSNTLSVNEKNISNSLNQGKYIIASMGPGTFTSSGHFIVISGFNGYSFTINDPFNKKFSSQNWSYSEFGNQIKSMWALSYN